MKVAHEGSSATQNSTNKASDCSYFSTREPSWLRRLRFGGLLGQFSQLFAELGVLVLYCFSCSANSCASRDEDKEPPDDERDRNHIHKDGPVHVTSLGPISEKHWLLRPTANAAESERRNRAVCGF